MRVKFIVLIPHQFVALDPCQDGARGGREEVEVKAGEDQEVLLGLRHAASQAKAPRGWEHGGGRDGDAKGEFHGLLRRSCISSAETMCQIEELSVCSI